MVAKKKTNTSVQNTKKNIKRTPKKRVSSKPRRGSKKKRRSTNRKGVLLSSSLKQVLYALVWNNYTKAFLAFLIAICALYGSYTLFIRPYSYRWMPCFGNKSYGICMPFKYDVHGLDVSRHQGAISWDHVIAAIDSISPLYFVFIKATEGGDFKDVNFKYNFKEVKRVGLIRGAYHFFSPKTSARKQATFYIQNVKLEQGDLPPVLDVEVLGNNTSKSLKDSVLTWLSIVEKHYNVKPILYTSFKFKKRYLNSPDFDKYPFWIAHYYVDRVRYNGKWNFWQHADIGVVDGISGDVDLNVFNGSLEELKALTLH